MIIAANKLCGALVNEDNKAHDNSIYAGMYALRLASEMQGPMSAPLLMISNSVVKALDGDEYYQPILSEKEFWPFIFRHGGPNKQDLSAIMEHASLFSDYEDTRFFSLLSDSHEANYKETLLKKEKETLKKKAAKKAKEASNSTGFGGAPDPGKTPDPDDDDKDQHQNKKSKSKSKGTKSPKTEIDVDVRSLKSRVKSAIERFDKLKLFEKYDKHIFSEQHVKDGLMELGNSKWGIYNRCARIAEKVGKNGLLREGTNQIKCSINNIQTEIKLDIFEGNVRSFDIIRGWSGRVIHHAVNIRGSF